MLNLSIVARVLHNIVFTSLNFIKTAYSNVKHIIKPFNLFSWIMLLILKKGIKIILLRGFLKKLQLNFFLNYFNFFNSLN